MSGQTAKRLLEEGSCPICSALLEYSPEEVWCPTCKALWLLPTVHSWEGARKTGAE